MLRRARPRYAVPFAWAVRGDGVALWDMLYQQRLALQCGIPHDPTSGVPPALPVGMAASGALGDAVDGDGDRVGSGSGSEETYDKFLGMASGTDGSATDGSVGDVSTGIDSAHGPTASEVESGGSGSITSPAGPHFWLDST